MRQNNEQHQPPDDKINCKARKKTHFYFPVGANAPPRLLFVFPVGPATLLASCRATTPVPVRRGFHKSLWDEEIKPDYHALRFWVRHHQAPLHLPKLMYHAPQ